MTIYILLLVITIVALLVVDGSPVVDAKDEINGYTRYQSQYYHNFNETTDRRFLDLNYSSKKLRSMLKDDVVEMFTYGYDSYMNHAFPKDELNPITCKGSNLFGEYSLTYIDTLDSLLLMGKVEEFRKGVYWVANNIDFNKDVNVSVFETNIRILGGLLSSHLLSEIHLPEYKGELLPHALDIAERLLPAFNTPTGIPYGAVNLKYGINKGETPIVCTAAAGTFALEFGVLSRLTGKPIFEKVAKKATKALWKYRSGLDLVGNHIDNSNGEWTIKEAGIGTGIDSFYEYLLKAAIFFDDEDYMDIFIKSYRAIYKYIRKDPWYVEVHMYKALIVWPIYNSLQSFWPGLQTLAGEFEDAFSTVKAFHAVWRRFGFVPEGYNLMSGLVHPGQKAYPLRPELAESLYYMYMATKDPVFIKMGRDMVWSLNNISRTDCGYAIIEDVETHILSDKMESFFLAETCKYLYLLFDDENNNMLSNISFVFNTEGHIFPMQYRFLEKPTISSTYVKGKKVKQSLQAILDEITNDRKRKQQELNNPQQTNQQNEKELSEDSSKQQKQQLNLESHDIVADSNKQTDDNVEVSTSTKRLTTSEEVVKIYGLEKYDDLLKNLETNWKCKPHSFARKMSSGTLQFSTNGAPQETEWYEDKSLIDSIMAINKLKI